MDSKNTTKFLEDIKKLMFFFNKDTKQYLINNTDIKYEYKSNIIDGLLYLLLNTKKESTHLNSSIQISLFNKNKISRQALDKRASQIKLNDLNKIINDFYNTFLINFNNEFNIADGVAINVYDPTDDKGYKKIKLLSIVGSKICPRELHINKDIYKSELALFYDLLDNGYYQPNKTFVLDALYFSDKLVNRMYNENLTFIGRMKRNSLYLNKFYVELDKKIFLNDYEVINKQGNKIRIVSYKINNKIYHLATNLLDVEKYKPSYFQNAYKIRWDVELFIKITKANTNLENLKTKNDTKLEINSKTILLTTMIYNYIICLYKKYSNTKKSINNSQFIESFYSDLIFKIFKKKFNKTSLTFLFSLFIVLYTDSNKNNNERKAIMPYRCKWHYKSTFKDI